MRCAIKNARCVGERERRDRGAYVPVQLALRESEQVVEDVLRNGYSIPRPEDFVPPDEVLDLLALRLAHRDERDKKGR